MEYTDSQKAEFKRQFSDRRRRQFVAITPILSILLFRVALHDNPTPFGLSAGFWAGIMIATVLGVVAFSLYNWRCPACNKYLGRGMGPQFCAKCGIELK